MIVQGAKIQSEVQVTNGEPVAVTVTFLPTCTCLEVTPGSQSIPAGRRASFAMSYDSTDDRGITIKGYLVSTDLAGAQPLHYLVRGTVRDHGGTPAAPGAWTLHGPAPGGGAGAPLSVTYYYTPGCRSCEEFLSVEIPRLEKQLGRRIQLQKRDLMDTAPYEELAAFASARGQAITAIPVLRAGDTLLQGDSVIRERLPGVLASMAGPSASSEAVPASVPATDQLALFPVIAAGLIDGINPCAFTTLIFLLASLALAGRARREVLVIGGLFSFAVFVSYSLIGLGFFTAFHALAGISFVSLVLRWVLVAVLLVFAGLSVYDFTLIHAGRASEMVLQLPSSFKKRIHASIRTRVRVAALAGSSLVLGFLVSLFEFACTGQVYLPLLGYLARMRRHVDALGLLALYNLCFILPLLVVFGASYLGVGSEKITTLFRAHMGKVKIGLAVVFF